jgi:hypothetical protein
VKLLVLTTEAITAEQLQQALPDGVDPHDAEVMLVAPALHASPLKFWIGDADEAIAGAERVRDETLGALREDGISATGDTGEGDPLEAIQDALVTFPADRILLFTHEGESRRYREDVDAGLARERFGVPVDQVRVGGSAATS